MYEYIPTGKRQGMKLLCLGLFLAAIVLFGASGIKSLQFTGVMQTLSVLLLAITIMLMGRYLLRHYMYRIADDGEGMDLTIDELSRSGRYTVCRLALKDLAAAEPATKENKPHGSVKVYNYCVDMRPNNAWLLTFRDKDQYIYLRLSPDETMAKMLSEAVAAFAQKGENSDHD